MGVSGGITAGSNVSVSGTLTGLSNVNVQGKFTVTGTKDSGLVGQGVTMGNDGIDGNTGIEIVSYTDQLSYIDFTHINTDFKGRILYDNSTEVMRFSTALVERMSVSASGLTTGVVTCDRLISSNPSIAFFVITATYQIPANSFSYFANLTSTQLNPAFTNILNRGGMTLTNGSISVTQTGVYQISAMWFLSSHTSTFLPTSYWTGISTTGGTIIRRCRGNNVNFQATLTANESYTFFITNASASAITISTGGTTESPNNYFSLSLLT